MLTPEQMAVVEQLVDRAYPLVPDFETFVGGGRGDAFLGYDNYMESVQGEANKLRTAGFACNGYLLEKITSMKRRHEEAIRLLDRAEKVITGKA